MRTALNRPARKRVAEIVRCNVGYVPFFSFFPVTLNHERTFMRVFWRQQLAARWATLGRTMRRPTQVVATALAWAFVIAPSAGAAPGQLDGQFNFNLQAGSFGRLFSNVGTQGIASINAVAIQNDGKMVVGGTCYSTLPTDLVVRARWCLQRYRAPPTLSGQGSWLDTGFGNLGTVIVPFNSFDLTLQSIALTPDNKIYVAGNCPFFSSASQFCVARLLSNGSLDMTFTNTSGGSGLSGYAFAELGTSYASGVLVKALLQPDGRLLLVGSCALVSSPTASPGQNNFCLVRINPNSGTDTTFGTNGHVRSIEAAAREATGAVLRADGSVVVSGTCFDNASVVFCARAYDRSGAVRTDFGSDSATHTTFAGMNSGALVTQSASGGIAETASGKLLIAGLCSNSGVSASAGLFCVVRLNQSGFLDDDFGFDPTQPSRIFTALASGRSTPSAIAVQPDGKFIVTGTCTSGTPAQNDFCASRYHANGELDGSFNPNAAAGVPRGFNRQLTGNPPAGSHALALQPDGKAVIAGECKVGTQTQFCTVRLEGGPYGYRNCTMDIDGDGQVMALSDALIHTRVSAGMSGDAVLNGVTFLPGAKRTTWPAIRDYLANECAMEVLP